MMKKHKCPVCQKHEFEEYGSFDFCPVCGWCDDPLESSKPGYKGGYNGMTVEEAWTACVENCNAALQGAK